MGQRERLEAFRIRRAAALVLVLFLLIASMTSCSVHALLVRMTPNTQTTAQATHSTSAKKPAKKTAKTNQHKTAKKTRTGNQTIAGRAGRRQSGERAIGGTERRRENRDSEQSAGNRAKQRQTGAAPIPLLHRNQRKRRFGRRIRQRGVPRPRRRTRMATRRSHIRPIHGRQLRFRSRAVPSIGNDVRSRHHARWNTAAGSTTT